MAIFERRASNKVLLDDTEAIKCTIDNWIHVDGHTEFLIKVHRGPLSNESWKINRRYNDFRRLHNILQTSGIPLELPPKKLIGNMNPYFVSERQRGLQKYLDSVFMNPILASSLPARSFVDPTNYCQPFAELALQHVSLALRGEVDWVVLGPIPEMGWRLRKRYYQLKCKSLPKEELLASWTDYGPDKYLQDRDMQSVFKSLGQMQHPYIHPAELCLCTDIGALVARIGHKDGSLRDILCNSKPRQSFLKKYGNPKGHKSLTIDQISLYGRQILEALKFLHDKGLPYGHLHTGNVIIDNDRVQILDIENGILGVPSYYKPYFTQHKKINTLQAIDVYCFGHVLYEMMFGAPLRESVVEYIKSCPIKSILERILTPESCRNGLPTITELLNEPFFSFVHLNLKLSDRAYLKISSSVKEHLKAAITKTVDKLKEEQKMIRNQKRLTRMQEMLSSEEEKKKPKQKRKQDSKDQEKHRRSLERLCTMNGDRPDSINSSTHTSVGTSTPPSNSGSNVPSPPPSTLFMPSSKNPPPPPPPPPPSPPRQHLVNGNSNMNRSSFAVTNERSALLEAINSFNKSGLRKTKVS